MTVNESLLGQGASYPREYDPSVLFAISRADARGASGIGPDLPFSGVDIWNAWELTWLDGNGCPAIATAEIRVPADSENLVESKSLKLYLGSFAMTRFESREELAATIAKDLSKCTAGNVEVSLDVDSGIARLNGQCIDTVAVGCDTWEVEPAFLRADDSEIVEESLHTHLLRSLCPVTEQPDMGSLLVAYRGPRLDPAGLLQYVVSFREHNDFHEACVERMFADILERCGPEALTVSARYQRRGGIDINPFRTNCGDVAANPRLWRQ